jgi:hypothetical protein
VLATLLGLAMPAFGQKASTDDMWKAAKEGETAPVVESGAFRPRLVAMKHSIDPSDPAQREMPYGLVRLVHGAPGQRKLSMSIQGGEAVDIAYGDYTDYLRLPVGDITITMTGEKLAEARTFKLNVEADVQTVLFSGAEIGPRLLADPGLPGTQHWQQSS